MNGDENIFSLRGEENPKSLTDPSAWHGCAIARGVLMVSATEEDGWGWFSFKEAQAGGEARMIGYEEAASEVRKKAVGLCECELVEGKDYVLETGGRALCI